MKILVINNSLEEKHVERISAAAKSVGAYGVSIAEHMIATTLVMMRRLDEFLLETHEGKWLSPRPQKSLTEPLPKESRMWHVKNLLITPHIAGNMTLPYTRDKTWTCSSRICIIL